MSSDAITREDLFRRVLSLPARERTLAVRLARDHYTLRNVEGTPESRGLARDPEHRARFAGHPARYIRDVLRVPFLTPQQERWLEEIESNDRILIATASNIGKTFELSAYALYRYDAVSALPGLDGREQGGRVLLVGPLADTVRRTIYEAVVKHAQRAAAAGLGMPSLPWAGPEWGIEVFAPQWRVDRPVAAGLLGRHHTNQVALIEEASDVEEPAFAAIEASCSGAGNKVIAIFNPHRPAGAAYSRRGLYRLLHASAMEHPNVLERRVVIPGAVSVDKIEGRIPVECSDLGPYPKTQPDRKRNDFVYAIGAGPEVMVRGRDRARLHVYRPGRLFEAQILGRWPTSGSGDLFDAVAWDEGVDRWRAGQDPPEPPDRVGLDPAREGRNSSVAIGAWGEDGEALLRAHAEARRSGSEAIAKLLARRRVRVSMPVVLPKGDGPTVGDACLDVFPISPILLDEGGPGAAVLDYFVHTAKHDAMGVSFGETAPEPTPGEPWSENLRTALYVRAALLTAYGLVDPPDDPLLRQEVLAHTLKHRSRTVKMHGAHGEILKARKPSVLLVEKDEIKRQIGRSPDRAEAYVLALAKQWTKRASGGIAFGLVRGSAGVFKED